VEEIPDTAAAASVYCRLHSLAHPALHRLRLPHGEDFSSL
jgi:hypothetical protein